jgi:hypothetical protein
MEEALKNVGQLGSPLLLSSLDKAVREATRTPGWAAHEIVFASYLYHRN